MTSPNSTAIPTAIRKRSVDIAGHRTSVSIEEPFWDALKDLATRESISLNELITRIDGARDGNLSSAIRVYVLRALRS
jgi:predicted DNA-binding ribbon-helix-helix protein